jgi:hypothetical protein
LASNDASPISGTGCWKKGCAAVTSGGSGGKADPLDRVVTGEEAGDAVASGITAGGAGAGKGAGSSACCAIAAGGAGACATAGADKATGAGWDGAAVS